MNHGRMLQRQLHLIALKLSYEVPLNVRQLDLTFGQLLWSVFSKRLMQLAERFDPFPLGVLRHGDQTHLVDRPTATLAGGCYLIVNRIQILSQEIMNRHSRLPASLFVMKVLQDKSWSLRVAKSTGLFFGILSGTGQIAAIAADEF